jgi:predicted dehydrogenase
METVKCYILAIDVQLAVKIGIIGYRNHAMRLLSLLEERNDCEISSIYHPVKSINDSRSTKNLDDLYKCDAVLIASPNHTHFTYIEKLLKNSDGYIFCEKPPVTSLNDLETLEKLPTQKKHRIFFNFNFRFSKISENLKNYINSNKIGQLIHVNIISAHGLAFKKNYIDSWRADGKNNLHNILDTVSIHYLDLLNYHMGKFDESFYFPSLISRNGSSYDTSHVVMKYNNGTTVSILNSYASPLINELLILGTNGYFAVRNDQLAVYSPRDTFDARGYFVTPPILKKSTFSMKDDYEESLKKSLNYFMSNVNKKIPMSIDHFNASLSTNRLGINLHKQNHVLDEG